MPRLSTSPRVQVVCKSVWLKPEVATYEGGLLRLANEKGVAGVPKLIAHGIVQDARGQNVSVSSLHGLDSTQDDDTNLLQVRIFMESAESVDFEHASIIELLEAVRDIARPIWSLWSKAQIRHRDLSINNVKVARAHRTDANVKRLRTKKLELDESDTRLCAELLDLGNAVKQGTKSGADCRSGTLVYMSIRMCHLLNVESDVERLTRELESFQDDGTSRSKLQLAGIQNELDMALEVSSKPHTVGDDLESLLYVFLICLAERRRKVEAFRKWAPGTPTRRSSRV